MIRLKLMQPNFPIGRGMRNSFARAALMGLALAVWAGAQPGEMRDGPPHDGPPGMEMMIPRLMRELNLPPEQQQKLKEAHLALQKRKIQLQSDKAILELDLKNVFSTYPVNQSEAMKIGEKIADVERKLTLLKVEAMGKFLAGLTADQHRKVQEIQADLMEKRRAWSEEFHHGRKDWKADDRDGHDHDGAPGPR